MTKISKNNIYHYKIGVLYPRNKYPIPMPNVDKCRYCSCPIQFRPILEITDLGFIIKKWISTNSKGERHHCLKYKMGEVASLPHPP